jgi:hypothetical protein
LGLRFCQIRPARRARLWRAQRGDFERSGERRGDERSREDGDFIWTGRGSILKGWSGPKAKQKARTSTSAPGVARASARAGTFIEQPSPWVRLLRHSHSRWVARAPGFPMASAKLRRCPTAPRLRGKQASFGCSFGCLSGVERLMSAPASEPLLHDARCLGAALASDWQPELGHPCGRAGE